jgi:hypothetical protein
MSERLITRSLGGPDFGPEPMIAFDQRVHRVVRHEKPARRSRELLHCNLAISGGAASADLGQPMARALQNFWRS